MGVVSVIFHIQQRCISAPPHRRVRKQSGLGFSHCNARSNGEIPSLHSETMLTLHPWCISSRVVKMFPCSTEV